MNFISQAPEFLQLIASLVLALYAVMSAASLIFGFIGQVFPSQTWATSAAKACSAIGASLYTFGAWLGTFFGGSKAAQRGYTGLRTMVAMSFCAIVAFVGIAIMTSGCTPAQSAAWSKVPGIVAVDLEKGDTLAQVQTDVLTDLGLNAAVQADVAEAETIVDDVVMFLLDSGALSSVATPRAQAMHVSLVAAKAARLKAHP